MFPTAFENEDSDSFRLGTLTAILLIRVRVPLTTNRDRKLELGKGQRMCKEVKRISIVWVKSNLDRRLRLREPT